MKYFVRFYAYSYDPNSDGLTPCGDMHHMPGLLSEDTALHSAKMRLREIQKTNPSCIAFELFRGRSESEIKTRPIKGLHVYCP